MIGRRTAGILLSVALAGAATSGLAAQANVEEQARRQLESGREFYRNGRYSEALKDFQTVAEGYPTSSVADDALLAIALYQLEIQLDPATARTTADQLIKKYATSDSAPMGYVVMGRATLELDQSPAGLDSALASFDRVPRLFPQSDAVAPALYYGAEVDRRAARRAQALDRLRDLALQYPRSVWAARAALLEARLLVTNGEPTEAMRVLQRVIRGFGSSEEATTARAWNTTLYRLTIRPPAEPAYGYSGRSLAGASGKFRDVESIALGADGRLGSATRGGILLLDDKGAVARQGCASMTST
jgi:TolA-binding protein